MLPYVIAATVFAMGLVVAYRSLGGTALGPVESESWLLRLCDMAEATATTVDGVCAAPSLVSPSLADIVRVEGETGRKSILEVAAKAQKQLSGCQQQLVQLNFGGNPSMSEVAGLITTALDDYLWACRLIHAGNVGSNPGMLEAVAALQKHGRAALDQARATTHGL